MVLVELMLVTALVLCFGILAVQAINLVYLSYTTRNRLRLGKRPSSQAALTDNALPQVLVQLPIYNEVSVATRAIDAVVQIRYPKALLEIQVLDDSDDETSEIIATYLRENQLEDRVHHLRRNHRIDFKAGALRDGMKLSNAPFIAIFDADFVPAPDFLEVTIPYLISEPDLAFVQTRWSYLNLGASTLTKIIARTLDMHFTIEQYGRWASGNVLNFNGTSGLLRRHAIDRAQGWEGDTLTEDMDLSYRMALCGLKGLYLLEYATPSELPTQLAVYQKQQQRWAQGGFQTAKKLLPRIVKTSNWTMTEKLQASLHLLHGLVYPATLGLTLCALPLTFLNSFHHPWNLFFLLSFCLSSVTWFAYASSHAALHRSQSFWSKTSEILWIGLLGTSLVISNSRAFFSALVEKPTEFIRTPKLGTASKPKNLHSKTSAKDWVPYLILGTISAATAYRLFQLASWQGLLYCELALGYWLPIWATKGLELPQGPQPSA